MFRSFRRFASSLREEILGPCNNPCMTCEDRFHCINKKALMSPTHYLVWGGLVLASSIPLYASLNPQSFMSWVAGASSKLEMMDEEDKDLVFGSVLEKLGIQYPERISVVITDGAGPTCMGADGPRGGVIFFPLELFALMNPATEVSFEGVYEGPVGELDETHRRQLLDLGYLVPTPEQLMFVMGHEAAHLRHKHTYETTKVALFTALCTHAFLKAGNVWGFRTNRRWAQLRSTAIHSALVVGVTAMVVAALSWDQELQADATAARRMGLQEEALDLKTQQVVQQQHAGRFDIDLEHPPARLQELNLKWLKESIKEKANSKFQ